MTDGSDIIVRWEINNATARLATGKVESKVFNKGGFKWSAIARREPDGSATFDLQCGVDHNGPWKCAADIGTWILSAGYRMVHLVVPAPVFFFDENNCVSQQKSGLAWANLSDARRYNLNDKVTIEFRIRVISSDRGEPISFSFAAPNNKSDVILVIGEKKLHVNKQFLAVHSPVFDSLFFGDYVEKGKDEVEIKDVIYEEFHDLLQLIYHEKDLSARTVLHVLKLADRFQMKAIMNKSESYLIQSIGMDNKLQIADQYRFTKLRDHCLESFTDRNQLIEKCKSLESADFSAETKLAIYDRIMKI